MEQTYNLRTGDRFWVHPGGNSYTVEGVSLSAFPEGDAVVILSLRDEQTLGLIGVHPNWFRTNPIVRVQSSMGSIKVPCWVGTLTAYAGPDERYPEIHVNLRRTDGVEVNLCSILSDIPKALSEIEGQQGCAGGVKLLAWESRESEDPSHEYLFTGEALYDDSAYEEKHDGER